MRTLAEEAQNQKRRGVLVVLTGPTGAGKDSVAEKLLALNPAMHRIITTTTRTKRRGESEGNPYHFLHRQEFEVRIANGEFFEWVEFRQELYGTTKIELEQALKGGEDVIWIIDLKGTKNIQEKVRTYTPTSAFIFLGTQSISTLKNRVRSDERSTMAKRWNEAIAIWEMAQFSDCEYLVLNEDGMLDEAVNQIRSIITAKHLEIIPD